MAGIKKCRQPKTLVRKLRSITLNNRPPDAVDRFAAIPLLFEPLSETAEEIGHVEYDSWSGRKAISLRDVGAGHIRRLKLRAGKITLEIVAEFDHGRWEFVARVNGNDRILHEFVLRAGARRILAVSGGYYCWQSKSVPRRLSLHSQRKSIEFEGLSWA